ncbi:ATPase, AAA-type, core [Cynara cardunculus var. scolymus]|uniref:Pachytene checkpoint protein 2 homolog n=1 Tax=Cynara cardunculus var. scolymus TaxID=59895 RepID=A0A103YCV2_CYNCS|nr:ATPase, AAA-type, core [Cynara cardunculus var. scolymus]
METAQPRGVDREELVVNMIKTEEESQRATRRPPMATPLDRVRKKELSKVADVNGDDAVSTDELATLLVIQQERKPKTSNPQSLESGCDHHRVLCLRIRLRSKLLHPENLKAWLFAIDSSALFEILQALDEVESLVAARKDALSGSKPSDSLRVVNALLTKMEKLKSSPNVIILTTSIITTAIVDHWTFLFIMIHFPLIQLGEYGVDRVGDVVHHKGGKIWLEHMDCLLQLKTLLEQQSHSLVLSL